MPLLLAVLRFVGGLILVVGLALTLVVTADDVGGWQTWLFRAGHRIPYVEDQDAGTRTVAFLLRPKEDVTRAVQACAHSFDKMLLQDGTFVHCVAYDSAQAAQQSHQRPQLICERGRAIQMPYGSARDATIVLNRQQQCAVQLTYLPEYVREYSR